MVAPVTGPFTRIESLNFLNGQRRYQRQLTWYRQKPPYTTRLAFSSNTGYAQSTESSPQGVVSLTPASSPYYALCIADAKSKAYRKLIAAKGNTIELGVDLVEFRQARTMVVSRLVQLTQFARALNRFDFSKAKRVLGLPPKTKGGWSKSKSVSNNWLEFHFGWSPLLSDIHDAMDVLQNALGFRTIKGNGHSSRYESRSNYPPAPGGTRGTRVYCQAYVQYIADIRVTNPNLALFNNMGLLNPYGIAWEVVPWSFVLDWFVNVSQCIGAWTDWIGYAGENITTSTLVRMSCDFRWNPYPYVGAIQRTFFDRVYGLQGPTLYVKPFVGFSLSRGATAIALLIQQIPKRHG